MQIKPTLLLTVEANGRAVAIARIEDEGMIRQAITFAVSRKRELADQTDEPLIARRFRREALEIEELAAI